MRFGDLGLVNALDGVGVFAVTLRQFVERLVRVIVAPYFHISHGELVQNFHVRRVEGIVVLGVLQKRDGRGQRLVGRLQSLVNGLFRSGGRRRQSRDAQENKKNQKG